MSDTVWIRDVVERSEQDLLRYARSLLGDAERARDVVQETFLRLCREPRSKVEGHEIEWLFTVCRNRAVDVQRKEARMTTASEPGRTAESREHDPAVVTERQDSVDRVLALLGTIPERQQEVIRLKFQAGLSYREIARVTELTVSNVGFLIHQGMKTLREKVAAGSNVAPGATGRAS